MSRIAISIITHNRYDVFKKSLREIKKYKPDNADIFIVDDGSKNPVKEATFRFETPNGIAVAKNKAFELADGYDYHFAFDDDVYPIKKDWHFEYINTGLNHLCFTFDTFSNGRPNGRVKVSESNGIVNYKEPCGCMNFYTKKCFDVIGGMDPAFGAWSYEHVSHSMRIHQAGLTPYPFMDIKNSLDLFYSYDWDEATERSFDFQTRLKLGRINERKYRSEIKSSRFIPYKPEKNIVLTCYFTTLIDPQRGTKWDYNPNALTALQNSIPDGVSFASITDHEGYTPKHTNPYMAKWIAFKEYLTAHPEYDNIALVDGTDVEVLNNPFPHIERGKLYCGDETGTLNNPWLKAHHPQYLPFINTYKRVPILNAGVIIGHRDILLEFLDKMIERIPMDNSMTDMALYNYTLRTYFNTNIVSGRQVTTVFKANQRTSAWIKHK